jgi:peptide/nickel transport system substrate-binding protein
VPESTTRMAMLKRGEVDVAYLLDVPQAQEVKRDPNLKLAFSGGIAVFFLDFLDQWDPKSPWHDRRVRLAANLAIDRKSINEAITLGHSKLTHSIIPSTFDFYWQPPAYPFDPAQARKLLAEAGYPKGFDAGDYYLDISYANVQEAIANYLQQVGIRTKLVSRERASHWSTYADKKYKNLAYTASGAFGNAATRLEAYVVAGGSYVYGSYPDIDALFKEQATELDKKKREAILHKIQELVHEKSIYAPIWQLAFINGAGPRVKESGLGLIEGHAYSAPYEDLTLTGK